ncbi:hypothetical protein [Myroides sp. N17-2]|uniref:hypothetical protein n=1 Tax=Myroides sp. N17-2 TaxID=2030799 RepID=UPI000EFCB41A|nr:hypothetical protein [Myroides sp. N17-2]
MGLFDFLKKKTTSDPPLECNYADICSYQEAEHYYKTGQLGKLYLVGLAFGGDDSPFNIVYAPKEAVIEKQLIDNALEAILHQGLHLQYRAFPEYKGNSFIPSKIIIEVDGNNTYKEVIDIW